MLVPLLAVLYLHYMLFIVDADAVDVVLVGEDEQLKGVVELEGADFVVAVGVDLFHCGLDLRDCEGCWSSGVGEEVGEEVEELWRLQGSVAIGVVVAVDLGDKVLQLRL